MKKNMVVLGIIALAIGAVVVFFNCNYSKQYRNFDNEMRSRLKTVNENTDYCSAEEINQLPTCLKDFCTSINKYNFNRCFQNHNIKFMFF